MATEAQCDACGEANPSDAAFCGVCGAYLGWNERVPVPGQPSPAAASEPAVEVPDPTPTPPPTQPVTPPPAPTPGPPPGLPPPERVRAAEVVVATPSCPSCGHPTEEGRRFCGRCGHPLVATAAGSPLPEETPPPTSAGRTWWWEDTPERQARRAYRRSLPPVYRWRRSLGVVVALALLGALVWLVANDPVQRVRSTWDRLTGDPQVLGVVTAAAVPEGSAVEGRGPERVHDGEPGTAWAVPWDPAATVAGGCAPPAGAVRLTWEGPAEVRELRVLVGLGGEGNEPDRVFRPRVVRVLAGEQCAEVTVDDRRDWQTFEVDLGRAVDAVLLGVVEAAPPETSPALAQVALREVEIRGWPE